jgi:hypothetical protein
MQNDLAGAFAPVSEQDARELHLHATAAKRLHPQDADALLGMAKAGACRAR